MSYIIVIDILCKIAIYVQNCIYNNYRYICAKLPFVCKIAVQNNWFLSWTYELGILRPPFWDQKYIIQITFLKIFLYLKYFEFVLLLYKYTIKKYFLNKFLTGKWFMQNNCIFAYWCKITALVVERLNTLKGRSVKKLN